MRIAVICFDIQKKKLSNNILDNSVFFRLAEIYYLDSLLLALLFLLFLLSRNYKNDLYKTLDKKEHPFRMLYGMAFFLMNFLPSHFGHSTKTKKVLEQLHVGQNISALQQLDTAKRFSCSILFLAVFLVLGLSYSVYCIQQQGSITTLAKTNEEGTYSLEVTLENKETQIIDITVPAKEFDFQTSLELFESYRESIITELLGENPSIEEISKPLHFISGYGDEGLTISWETEEENLIDDSGAIHPENISEYGAATTVTAYLSLGEYHTALTIPLILVP